MRPVLAAALARAEAADALPVDGVPFARAAALPRRVSKTRRVVRRLYGVFWTLDGFAPGTKGRR